MSNDGATPLPPPASTATPPAEAPSAAPSTPLSTWLISAVAVAGLGSSALLWQKVVGMQEQLAQQTAQSTAQATEAHTLARQSQDVVRDTNARIAVVEARVQEATLQRSQLEELMASVSRSRDETLLIDLESALRMSLQQAQLSGSLEPLIGALKSAAQRLERTAQPRLVVVQRAIEQDVERLSRSHVTDTAGLLGRLDELVRVADELPLLSSVVHANTLNAGALGSGVPLPPSVDAALTPMQWAWWQRWGERIWAASANEVRQLVRIRRIDHPDAALLAPEQAYFLRENLKLKLLNARLGLLARQYDASRADINNASVSIAKYFDTQSRRTQNAQALLQQIQVHLRQTEQPSINDTLSALATAAASR